jgi:hypothetical protein
VNNVGCSNNELARRNVQLQFCSLHSYNMENIIKYI